MLRSPSRSWVYHERHQGSVFRMLLIIFESRTLSYITFEQAGLRL